MRKRAGCVMLMPPDRLRQHALAVRFACAEVTMTTTAVPIHVLGADSTRAEVEEALGHVCREAHRAPALIARFADSPPTTWDRLHVRLGELLDDWQAMSDADGA